jgi:rod shape-determining protein MreD
MFGLVKTLVGYFSATVSQKFDVDNIAVRFILAFFFYVFHQFFSWVLMRALLGLPGDFAPQREVILGLLNAAVALPLFHILDRLMVRN